MKDGEDFLGVEIDERDHPCSTPGADHMIRIQRVIAKHQCANALSFVFSQ